ncbi:MAG TPA: aldehyde dehydrogenase family protein [Planctomycetota bacterium]|nr:aldehyde dehydrogenase family protein [Planctomycetota bacterium]
MTTFRNYIAGKWVASKTGKTFPNRNPADQSDVIGEFPASDPRDVDAAVVAAKKAFDGWRRTPAPKRGELIFKVGEILSRRKEEIARAMTREMGKVLKETRGDVQEGIDTAVVHGGEGRRLHGFSAPSELPNKAGWTVRAPIGVAGLITPWNFPLAIPTWKSFPALVAGNTVILKPASDTPHCSHLLVEAFEEAGFPAGVVNLIHGSGSTVGNALVEHPEVRVISFTGSTAVGRDISAKAGKALKRVSLELGGKNAMIVMDDADLELALEGVLWGAFGTTGQRCTATSRLILHQSVREEFVRRLIGRVATLKVGSGLDETTDVGPLINKARVEAVDEYVRIGTKEGELLCGGAPLRSGAHRKGCFYAPTVFDRVPPSARIAREEIFGPVLSILTVKDLDEALRCLNDTAYGLSSSIYTRDINNAFYAIQELETGIVYVNAPTIGAECHYPFGGTKDTGNGHREGGTHPVYEVFTEWKTIYVDYSGRLQKAQIDNRKNE